MEVSVPFMKGDIGTKYQGILETHKEVGYIEESEFLQI
jgi:hypothetical protein